MHHQTDKQKARMVHGRQRDFALWKVEDRLAECKGFFLGIVRRREVLPRASSAYLAISLDELLEHEMERVLMLERRIAVAQHSFSDCFNNMSDGECLRNFRFQKCDIWRMVNVVGWPSSETHTERNRYSTNPLLSTCIVLNRLSNPSRWYDVEPFFGKHSSHLSEIFWETLESFYVKRKHLILGPISRSFLQNRAKMYAECVASAGSMLQYCVGFIYGTVIGIARTQASEMQRVVYSGHKRKHAMNFQALITPDGLISHASGSLESRRHDWTMYGFSGIDEQLAEALSIDGEQFYIYGDSGYNRRPHMEVPYVGSVLTDDQKECNKRISSVRVTVEWLFMDVKQQWTAIDFKRKLRIGQSPVGLMYLCTMLLHNCRACIYPNQISQKFKCPPPPLEEYLSHKD